MVALVGSFYGVDLFVVEMLINDAYLAEFMCRLKETASVKMLYERIALYAKRLFSSLFESCLQNRPFLTSNVSIPTSS